MEVVYLPALISHTSSPRKQYVVVLGAVPISSNYLLQLLQSAIAFYLIKQPSAFCRETINHLIENVHLPTYVSYFREGKGG